MKNDIFICGEKVAYLKPPYLNFENGFVLDYIDDSNMGRVFNVSDKGKYCVTDDEEVVKKYKETNDSSKKIKLLERTTSTIQKEFVLKEGDKRITNYERFYDFINKSKFSKYLDRNKEIMKYFNKKNSPIGICSKIIFNWFLNVVLLGLFQFLIGDLFNYFVLQHKLFIKREEIKNMRISNLTNDGKEKMNQLEEELEKLIDQKYENNRAFLAFIIALVTLLITVF